MGKASRRKRERRAEGLTKDSLRSMRGVLAVAQSTGGFSRLAIGEGGGKHHYVIVSVFGAPSPLCGFSGELVPSQEEEVSCPMCADVPKMELQQLAWAIKTDNEAAEAEIKRNLARFGG